MKPENAIEVKNITKSFKIYLDKGHTLKEKTLFSRRRKYEKREVLKGISFEVKKGEAIGLIGHNGCGKSTTLKLLTKIMYPDSGTIEMRGRVSSLLELGAGFHPDLSGRENIYINASIFGLTKMEIDERVEDIIAFSELEEFIDNPVRTYSSGMYMRLAFAVAINVDADILLIDEILAVGDINFQAKCFNKLREIKGKGVTIVIVSHSLAQIEQICDRSIWIDKGLIREEGKPVEVHPMYLEYMMEKDENRLASEKIEVRDKGETEEDNIEETTDKNEYGNKNIEITDVLIGDGKVEKNTFRIGDNIQICIKYKMNVPVETNVDIGFNVIRNDGVYYYGTTTHMDKIQEVKLKQNGIVKILLRGISALKGCYTMDVAFADNAREINYHYICKAVQFEIKDDKDDLGMFRISHTWEIN